MLRIPLTLRRRMLLPMAGALASSVGASRGADVRPEDRARAGGAMRLDLVKQRDVVKLRWGTDQPLTLHLHGYDIEQKSRRARSPK